jgi:ethanolamine utilization protein EutQ (cupin superfamily)
MSESENFGITFMTDGQAGADLVVNNAIEIIDTVLNIVTKDGDVVTKNGDVVYKSN